MFGLFSKERAHKRTQKRALNRLAQSADRWGALEKLAELGDDESLYTLCRRFSFTSLKLVEDEQEKAWVVQTLTGKGESALPVLLRYMKDAESAAYPLRVLENIASSEGALSAIDELLAAEPPGYTRMPKKRIDYIDWLAELEEVSPQDSTARIAPYLADYDENVRYAAVEALSHRPCQEQIEPLLAALVRDEEESGRFKVRIAELLAAAEFPLGDKKTAVQGLLDDVLSDFRLHQGKLVRK